MTRLAWIGVDVGADISQVCVTDDRGTLLGEAAVPTRARLVLDFVRSVVPTNPICIGMEGGTFAVPLARGLRSLGCEVKLFDSFQTSRFLQIRQHKTDRNDARGLAEVTRLGLVVTAIHLRSLDKQTIRSQLVIRKNILSKRLAMESLLRSVLRLNGCTVKPWRSATGIRKHVDSELARLCKEGIDLSTELSPLVDLCAATRIYLDHLTGRLEALADSIDVCRRWMEIPGVGPLTALAFYSGIDDPARFTNVADVGPYVGLAPRVRQSGTTTWIGRVTKRGDRLLRTQLVMAAASVMKTSAESELRAWGLAVKERRGHGRAQTALARKLATVMLAMWKSGSHFRAGPQARGQQPP